MYSDETSVVLQTRYPDRGWRKYGKPIYNEENKEFYLKYIKFWGCIGCIGYNGEKFLTNTRKPYNSKDYCRILKEGFIDTGFSKKYKLVQDSDGKHTSEFTSMFMRNNGIKILEDFPFQSPDCNIIENLWFILKKMFLRYLSQKH